jgi:hypothetical protein
MSDVVVVFSQVMVRPSYVLEGRAMETIYSDDDLSRNIETAVEVPTPH